MKQMVNILQQGRALVDIGFRWGWAKKINADTYVLMSNQFTCKDHLIDCLKDIDQPYLSFYTKKYTGDNKTYEKLTEYASPITELCLHLHLRTVTNLENAVKILNKLESKLKWKKTTLTKAHTTKHFYVLEGSKMWLSNTFLASLYLSLVRILLTVNITSIKTLQEDVRQYNVAIGGLSEKDYLMYLRKDYITTLVDNIPKLKVKLGNNKFGFNNIVDCNHGYGGIFTPFINKHFDVRNPYYTLIRSFFDGPTHVTPT